MVEASCQPRVEIVERLAATIDCKQKSVRAVRFNGDGEYCLTCGSDKTIKLWNPHRSLELKTYHGHGNEVLDAQSSCDNASICSGGMDRYVCNWDVSTGKNLRRFHGHKGRVNCVTFNEEASAIISGSVEGLVNIWDVRSRKLEPIQSLDEATDSVTSVCVTSHEILTSSVDHHVRRYDVRCGQMTSDFIGSPVTSISLTRDAQCILTATLDDTLRLIDKKTGELLNEYKGHKSSDFKIDCVIASDDRQVLSGSQDGCVYIWDLIKATPIGRLQHESGSIIHSASYHPTKPMLLTACGQKIFLWKSRFAAQAP